MSEHHWGDDAQLDWELLNTGDEAARMAFLRTGAPLPSRPPAAAPDVGEIRTIADPASRLTPEFEDALRRRYAVAASGDFADRYGAACDLAVQLLWPEVYGTNVDDPLLHTSDPARTIARLFCAALGIDMATEARRRDRAGTPQPPNDAEGAAGVWPSPISLWAACDDKACPKPHDLDPDGVRRHELPDDHPVVAAMHKQQTEEMDKR